MFGRSLSARGLFGNLSPSAWEQLEKVLERFEDSWRSGQQPNLDDYLNGSDGERQALLVELVHADLHYRLKAGLAARVEDYLTRYAELRDDPRVQVELIEAEYHLRKEREPDLSADEYLRRFPQLAAELAGLLNGQAPASPAGATRLNGETVDPRTGHDPFETLQLPPTEPSPNESGSEAVLPGYELLGKLGRGGMGVIYKARHLSSGRIVAVKMILSGALAEPQDRERFRAEVQAVAALRHPGIVTLYDVGETPSGPYYTMEYIEGGSLAKRLDGTPLPPDDAADLVRQLAEAIHAAHQQGIVHRDLKPGNVLLASNDSSIRELNNSANAKPQAALVPKIADFGLARRMDVTGQTATGAVLGTPSYMAPEQAQSQKHVVGPLSDVYALGAILYECLTGRPPFKGPTVADTLFQVVRDEPVPPRQLQSQIPPDLDTICLKCLSKDPVHRYSSALELANDLGRYLRREPVQARPVGRMERLGRWCRRNPAMASLVGAVAAVLLLGTGVATGLAVWAINEKNRADENNATALDNERLAQSNAERAKWEKAEKDRHSLREEWLVYREQIALAQTAWQEDRWEQARYYLDQTRWDFRGWEYHYLHALFAKDSVPRAEPLPPPKREDASPLANGPAARPLRTDPAEDNGKGFRTLTGHEYPVHAVTFSRDGKRLASASYDRKVRLWEADTGRKLCVLEGHTRNVTGVSFSRDGKRLASASWDKTVRLWDTETGKLCYTQEHKEPVWSVAFSPDGRLLASASEDGVRLWEADTGQGLRLLTGHTDWVLCVAFSPDGRLLASAARDGTVRVWDVDTAAEVRTLQGHTSRLVTAVSFSPDGQYLASASEDQTVRLWSTESWEPVHVLKGHIGPVYAVAFSRDSKRIASASADQTIRLWNVETGQDVVTLKRHNDTVAGVAFSPDGQHLASASYDRTVRLWDAAGDPEVRTLRGHTDRVTGLSFSPDGKRLATACEHMTARLWSMDTGQEVRILKDHTNIVSAVVFSPNGKYLASASWDATVQLWQPDTGQKLRTLRVRVPGVSERSGKSDGKRFAGTFRDQIAPTDDLSTDRMMAGLPDLSWEQVNGYPVLPSVQLCQFQQPPAIPQQPVAPPVEPQQPVAGPGDSGSRFGRVGGAELPDLPAVSPPVFIEPIGIARPRAVIDPAGVTTLAFSLDSRRLVSGSHDNKLHLWDVESGKEIRTFSGHRRPVTAVACSPDGWHLVSASEDKMVKLWDVNQERAIRTLDGHTAKVTAVAFSPNGKRLASASDDRTVRLWDAETGKEICVLKGHLDVVTAVVFSPTDGRRLVSASLDGTVRAWDVETGDALGMLTGNTKAVTALAFSCDGRRLAGASGNTVWLWDDYKLVPIPKLEAIPSKKLPLPKEDGK